MPRCIEASMTFQKGHTSKGGRRKGSRDRISTALLEAIAKDFEEYGEEAVKIARVEKPVEYLRIVASLLPKEFEIVDSRLHDITDEELDAFIEVARRRIITLADINGGEGQTTDAEPAQLLPPV
jgi:hypothetical protein